MRPALGLEGLHYGKLEASKLADTSLLCARGDLSTGLAGVNARWGPVVTVCAGFNCFARFPIHIAKLFPLGPKPR